MSNSTRPPVRLLQVLRSVDPAQGGPPECVRVIGLELERLGHTVEVLTLDAPGERFVADFPLPVHVMGPARGLYGYSPRLIPWLRANAREYDAVVVNGLWQFHGFATWRALHGGPVPYFVYPHGMLDPWFRRQYPLKHLKKWLYWPWADYRVLRDARAVLYTCEEERRGARESFWLYRAREQVVPFGTSTPPAGAAALREGFLVRWPELRGRRVLLFLGRIHEKKGCDLLLHAFAGLAAAAPDWQLVMAGPDDTDWARGLKHLAETLGIASRVCWTGMLRDELKWGAFYAAECFVLPSHQENFGIAVAEALGCGVPVLISNRVNIWHEIEQGQAGYVEEDTLAGARRLLQRWLQTPEEQRARLSQAARTLFASHFSASQMALGLLEVVQSNLVADTATLHG